MASEDVSAATATQEVYDSPPEYAPDFFEDPDAVTRQREFLAESAQNLLADINAKREKDEEVLADIRNRLHYEAEKQADAMRNFISEIYQRNNSKLESLSQKITSSVTNIAQMESDLAKVKSYLSTLCMGRKAATKLLNETAGDGDKDKSSES